MKEVGVQMVIWGLAVALSVSPAAAAPTDPAATVRTTPAAQHALGEGIGAILSGEGSRARAVLAAIPVGELSPRAAQARNCMVARLEGRDPGGDPIVKDRFVRRLLRIYRTYWSGAEMTAAADRGAVENRLVRSLRALLGRGAPPDLAALEPLVAARFERAKYHGLNGRTAPFRELMLWAGQEERHFAVELPGGRQDVRVIFLSDFVSEGWASYLSCGRTGTGGWTTADGIYAVRTGYPDLSSEHFRVNLLAHEGQHFWDKTHLMPLQSWELEYRAKLVELIAADTTREEVIRAFEVTQDDDPASAHAYANRRLLTVMRKRLGLGADGDLRSAPWPAIQAAALAEWNADTAGRPAKPTS